MKVAFYTYPSAFQNPGGGEYQLIKTKQYLQKEGVDVRLFDQWKDRLEEFDILHVFGSAKDSLGLVKTANNKRVKVALSTIFWSDYRRSINENGLAARRAMLFLRHTAKAVFPGFPSARRELIRSSDILFPNGNGEAAQVRRYFGADKGRIYVVPNGADERFKDADPGEFVKKYGVRDFVLYAGRIEPRKNQLNFIKAMKGVDRPVVFIGDPVSDYEGYYKMCREAAAPNMRFIGRIEHDSSLLASAYAACGVLTLTSWFETPGLCALEAALAGARVVITDGGCTREYFGDMVIYAKPDDPADIRAGVEKAFGAPADGRLKRHVLDNYTWDKVARATKKGYEKVLGKTA